MERHALFVGTLAALCTAWLYFYSAAALDDFYFGTSPFTPSDLFGPAQFIYSIAAALVFAGYCLYAIAPRYSEIASRLLPWLILAIAGAAYGYLYFFAEYHTFEWPLVQTLAAHTLAASGIALVAILLADLFFRVGGPFYADRSIPLRVCQILIIVGAAFAFTSGARAKGWYDYRPTRSIIVAHLASYSCMIETEPSGFTIAIENENLIAYRCGRSAALVRDKRREDPWFFVSGGRMCHRDLSRMDGTRTCQRIDELQITGPNVMSILFRDGPDGSAYETFDPPNNERATAEQNSGLEALSRGDRQAALQHFVAAIAYQPNYASAYNNRGNIYHALGRYREAIADFNHAISLTQAFPQSEDVATLAFNNRALSRSALGELPQALADFETALRRDPQYADAFNNRGVLKLDELNDARGAIDDFNAAITINPAHGRAFRNRARANLALEAFEAAATDYDAAASILADDPESLNGVCWARAILGIELETARMACDRALIATTGQQRADILDSRGLVGLKQNRPLDAWIDYNSAVSIDSSGASFLYGRGIAARRLGRMRESEGDIRAALALDSEIGTIYEQRGIN